MINPIEVVSTSEQAKPEQTRIPRRTGGLSPQSYCNLWQNPSEKSSKTTFSFICDFFKFTLHIYVYLLVLYVYLFLLFLSLGKSGIHSAVNGSLLWVDNRPQVARLFDLNTQGGDRESGVDKPSCLTT